MGDNHASDINPFFRKDVQHDKKDISGYLNEIFNFVSKSFNSFMVELAKEYPKKIYLHNRYNKLKGWQQKMKDTPDSDFAVAYIETSDDISTMPEEISVLLLNKCEDGTIYCKNCSLDTILVKKLEPSMSTLAAIKQMTHAAMIHYCNIENIIKIRSQEKLHFSKPPWNGRKSPFSTKSIHSLTLPQQVMITSS